LENGFGFLANFNGPIFKRILTTSEYALIVAGGKGTRIESPTPKQFIEIAGKPILLHTLEAFLRYSQNINIILVLPADDFHRWQMIRGKFAFENNIVVCEGGSTRFRSVKNGLDSITGSGVVAIHDGVRPLVHESTIRHSFELARKRGSAVACVALKESIRLMHDAGSKSQERSSFRMIQTPQTFEVSLIRKAYQIGEDPSLTDDASVAERAGIPIFLFEGSYDNIKVTTGEDLLIAEALLKAKTNL
jgi:2-C-methyl-D-erythritol 4-phosphate cytidylyltransferase